MEMIFACFLSFAVTGLAGGKLILPALRRLKAGQQIREAGPKWHATKAGTPTMGGLMFITGIAASIFAAGWQGMLAGDWSHIYVLLFALVFGVIGFLDDYEKVKRHQNLGLTALQKFLLQLAAAILFLMLMRYEGRLSPDLYVPFWNNSIHLSWPVYMVFAAFVIVGAVNAVNITDGLDGLAARRSCCSTRTRRRFSWGTLGPCFWGEPLRGWLSPSTCPWPWLWWGLSTSLKPCPIFCRWATSS